MDQLLQEIRQCSICRPHLPYGTNPVLSAHPDSKIAIIGQAPGSIVHQSGVPWEDKSGDRLRAWLQVGQSDFYNPANFALVPMGFCYPGQGKSGDLPPRKECAPQWHGQLFEQMDKLELILLVGSYAQAYYLKEKKQKTLTETVRNFKDYLPDYFVLPHPSPRNNIWMRKNPWFEKEALPALRHIVRGIFNK